MLKECCSVCNFADDGFVGLSFQDGVPHVSFPRGYTLSEDDESVRKDILGLIAVLQKFSNQREGNNRIGEGEDQTAFPILAYQYIIKNFIAHGYYSEREVEHRLNDHGKINWKRTIQQVQPQMDNDNVVYLNFITKRSISKANILTKIHEFCVYQSFTKLGWLYLSTAYLPKKPTLRFNKKLFLTTLNDALKNTFNSEKKLLFSSMIAIINDTNETANATEFQYGVQRFEYVWENLIDYVFGESNKEMYFPHATWHIINGNRAESSALEPDTIMKYDGKFYILDAKYYKFGITGLPIHLPATSSIQKQITYGEYVATKQLADRNTIYNAFIMPYSAPRNEEKFKVVSVGTADWVEYTSKTENYKYVLGILLDTRYIMQTYSRHNGKEIFDMSQLILDSLKTYRTNNDVISAQAR